MADFDEYGVALEQPPGLRSGGGRLSGIGQRLAQTFSRVDYGEEPHQDPGGQETVAWQNDMPRFAVVRHGYHCATVDQYVTELEQELGELDREIAQLRAQTPAEADVAAELKRVGEQTSAVLIAAHEQAAELVRQAEAEVERKLAAAKTQEETIVGRAQQRLRDLERETQSVHSQRGRLLEDVRGAAAGLSDLVDGSLQRFPPQPGSGESESDAQATDSYPVPA